MLVRSSANYIVSDRLTGHKISLIDSHKPIFEKKGGHQDKYQNLFTRGQKTGLGYLANSLSIFVSSLVSEMKILSLVFVVLF